MQTPTEQPPSPPPKAPPARRLRPGRIFIVAELAFCAALALVGAFLLRGPDESVDPAALREQMVAGPSWGRSVLLAALLLGLVAELDLLGRFLAVPLARIVHGRRATPRQSALLRLVAQAAFAALAVIGQLVAPNAFPSAHGWVRAAFFATLALPIGLSVANFARSCETKAEVRP